MKKIAGLLILFFALNACNDGNVVVQDISFESIAGVKCTTNNLVYKINGNLLLMLKIDDYSKAFKNEITAANTPRTYQIGSGVALTYRAYNGAVASSNICDSPPAANINLVEEWTAISGTIEITTTTNRTINATTNAAKITGYTHIVNIKNLVFQKPTGTQLYETFPFGSYVTSYSNNVFSLGTVVSKCPTTNSLTKKLGLTDFLVLDNNPNIINSSIAGVGIHTGTLSATNLLHYRIFPTTNTTDFSCQTTFTAANGMQEEWTASSGTYEVTTIANGGGTFKHSIVLKNVTLSNGNTDFYLGNTFDFGIYEN